MLLSSVSLQRRSRVMGIKPWAHHRSQVLDRPCYSSQVSNRPCFIAHRQISVTSPCYSSILFRKQQKIPSSRCEGIPTQRCEEKRVGEHASMWGRERELALAPLFICLSLPGPVLCKLGQPGVLFVLPEVLTLVLRPSFVLFSQAFPLPVFQPPSFWTPFPYSTYLPLSKSN